MITSNKFVKANYGRKTRNFLFEKQIIKIVDFGELPVFEEAATFPAIYQIQNNPRIQPIFFLQIKSLKFESLLDEVSKNGTFLPNESFGTDLWSLTNSKGSEILEKMKKTGIHLGNYIDGKIYRGLLTGFNKAFIIDENTRNELISKDPKSDEIIFPYALGDDIRKYQIRIEKRYIILTKIGVEISKYPAVYQHLKIYQNELEKRWDKGNHWWELRACAYYDEFTKPKIIFPDIAKDSRWAYTEDSLFIGNTAYIIPIKDFFLLGVMNSKSVYFFYSQIASVLGDASKGGRLRWINQDVIKIPVPFVNDSTKQLISEKVDQILTQKKTNPTADTTALENEIDALVYQLYNLTEEEIKIVEGR